MAEQVIELAPGDSVKIRFVGHKEVILVDHGELAADLGVRAVFLFETPEEEPEQLYASE